MHYQEYPIATPLIPFVKIIWSMESDVSTFSAPPMRILPDSCIELVVHYCDPYKTTFFDKTSALQPKSFVVGQMRQFIEIQPHGRVGFIAVRFSASGAYTFLGVPMGEVANGITNLELVWKSLASEIEDRIAAEATTALRIERIQQYLFLQFSRSGHHDSAVEQSVVLIQRAKGQLSIQQLADSLGISNRQLVRRFNSTIGLTPKEFSRITKFIAALHFLKRNSAKSLTEVSLECGYYDQAHFIHDFKEFSGLTPGNYLASENVVF